MDNMSHSSSVDRFSIRRVSVDNGKVGCDDVKIDVSVVSINNSDDLYDVGLYFNLLDTIVNELMNDLNVNVSVKYLSSFNLDNKLCEIEFNVLDKDLFYNKYGSRLRYLYKWEHTALINIHDLSIYVLSLVSKLVKYVGMTVEELFEKMFKDIISNTFTVISNVDGLLSSSLMKCILARKENLLMFDLKDYLIICDEDVEKYIAQKMIL
jgi:hypothetical protein